jgi:hypothetical protein
MVIDTLVGPKWLSFLEKIRNDQASLDEVTEYTQQCINTGEHLQGVLCLQIWLEFTASDKKWVACFNVGRIFSHLEHHEDAVRYFKRCLRLNPKFEPAVTGLLDSLDQLPVGM